MQFNSWFELTILFEAAILWRTWTPGENEEEYE